MVTYWCNNGLFYCGVCWGVVENVNPFFTVDNYSMCLWNDSMLNDGNGCEKCYGEYCGNVCVP